MIALIGDLIVKAALLIGVLVLAGGAGVATYGGVKVISDIAKPQPRPAVISERWIEPSPHPTSTPLIADSDPIIDCESDLCDGGRIRQSECRNSVCCQIGDKWIFYKNKDKCKQDQTEYWASLGEGNQGLSQKVDCVIGGRTYIFSSWDNCLKAREIYDYYTRIIPQPKDVFGPILEQFKQDAAGVVQEVEDYQVDLPPTPDFSSELEAIEEAGQIIEPTPTPKPKCPPTYVSGDVTVGGELPCEP